MRCCGNATHPQTYQIEWKWSTRLCNKTSNPIAANESSEDRMKRMDIVRLGLDLHIQPSPSAHWLAHPASRLTTSPQSVSLPISFACAQIQHDELQTWKHARFRESHALTPWSLVALNLTPAWVYSVADRTVLLSSNVTLHSPHSQFLHL